MWIVVGLAGVTCGGKTTLANTIVGCLPGNCKTFVVGADNYFLPKTDARHVKIEQMDAINWELNSSIDMENIHRDVKGLSLMSAQQESGTSTHNILFIDGHTILNYAPLFSTCDLRYYFTLSREECAGRRSRRYFAKPDKPGYFDMAVWPTYQAHRREVEGRAGVKMIDGMMPPEEIVLRVKKDIEELILQRC